MAKIIYNDGTKYGAAGAIYGRISPGLTVAQENQSRETGLRVTVIDERLNAWEYVAGQSVHTSEVYVPYLPLVSSWLLTYAWYRGSASMVVLTNGNIIRVRNGNPNDINDQQIYIQTITDPTSVAQWEDWSTVLYTGTHYNVVLVANGTSYIVYHSKSDGFYRNNVLVWAPSAAIGTPFTWSPVEGHPDAGWVTCIRQDVISGRTVDYYYTPNLPVTTPTADPNNYRWMRPYIAGIKIADGRVIRTQAGSLYHNPRDGNHGIAFWVQEQPSISVNTVSPPRPFRGIGGGSGRNGIAAPFIRLLSDGYYYLFYSEFHFSEEGAEVTSLGSLIPVWQRSRDLVNWTEPIVGPVVEASNVAGIVERSGYLYWADNGQVWRRPIGAVTTPIENYVPSLSFSIPRENQASSGEMVVANPNGVNDWLFDLSDREIKIELGIKTATGLFEFEQFDRFFIKQVNRVIEGEANRIRLNFGGILHRLENPLRDTYNFVGKTEWDDWYEGQRNKSFNYFFHDAINPPVELTNGTLQTEGTVLYTGWKGHNPHASAIFSSFNGNPSLYFRYVDSSNYMLLQLISSTLYLYQVVSGVSTQLASAGVSLGSFRKLEVDAKFNTIVAKYNNVTAFTFTSQDLKIVKPGYVGFFAGTSYILSNFHLEDWEYDLRLSDLIRTALAMGDFHEVTDSSPGNSRGIVTSETSKAYAIVWGPQTDVPTAAAGLLQMLEAGKLDLVWRDDHVIVGKFNDRQIRRTIQDRIISTDQIDEAARRVNLASVDGNEHFWIEVDPDDTHSRGRQIIGYYDLPELLTEQSVIDRAKEEIFKSTQGTSPGGQVVLLFDLWRMDRVTWIDNVGNSKDVRIEGISVEVDQGVNPRQIMTLDTTFDSPGSSGILMRARTGGGFS